LKKHFLTSDLAELLIDGLISVLFTLGIISPLFYTRMLETSWTASLAGCLLAVVLVVLLSRRWWLVPGLVLFVGLPGSWILARLKLLRPLIQAITEYANWAGERLLLGGPEPESEIWLVWLRFLLILLVTIPVFTLVRKTGRLIIFISLALLVGIPFLYAHPSAIPRILPSIAGLIALLPVSMVRTIKKSHPDAVMPRAPLQWLALPVAIISILVGQMITPADTSRWRQQDWINRFYDLRDFWQNQSGVNRGWQPFDIAVAGFRSSETRLGGPVRPSEQTFLDVKSPASVLLRGVTRTVYTGSSWQSPPHQVYRLDSALWRLSRRQVFTEDMPAGSDGRQFMDRYSRQITIEITPRTRLQTTIFSAGRLNELNWRDSRNYPPYFTVDSDLFVFNGLPENPAYSVTVMLFNRQQQGFAESIKSLSEAALRARDPYWTAITDRYLQLPDNLPAVVGDTAASVTAGEPDPYGQAVLLEQYFQKTYTYALDPDFPPDGMDFVAHLLQEQKGYCVHFATAMTVMARTLGLPARYIEGFALDPVADRDNTWRATGKTAHAWCEVYIQGIGWLTFDPTPAERIDPPDDPGGPIDGPIVEPVEPTPEPTLPPLEPTEPEPETGSFVWLIILFAILLLAISIRLLILTLVRNHLRNLRLTVMRRLEPDPALCLEAAYKDLLHQMTCLDIHPEAGETLTVFADRANNYLRFENMNLTDLLWPVVRWRYGNHTPSGKELDELLQMRLRLEDRLRESLSKSAWFWRRVLPAWFRNRKTKKGKTT
jgi:transglutaminase-like putative cysteine protease